MGAPPTHLQVVPILTSVSQQDMADSHYRVLGRHHNEATTTQEYFTNSPLVEGQIRTQIPRTTHKMGRGNQSGKKTKRKGYRIIVRYLHVQMSRGYQLASAMQIVKDCWKGELSSSPELTMDERGAEYWSLLDGKSW